MRLVASQMGAITGLLLVHLLHPSPCEAFSILAGQRRPQCPQLQYYHDHQYLSFTKRSTCLRAKKSRGSMAAKRKRRAQSAQKRQQVLQQQVSQLPASKLDFKTPPKPPSPTEPRLPTPEDTKAKQLVESQMESVKMLTYVTEQIGNIDMAQVSTSLDQQGYFVLDEFLKEDIVTQLEAEAKHLYDNNSMTQDIQNLGTGEFVTPIVGGQDQYPLCPRTIEWVVSMTSKFSACWNDYQKSLEEIDGPNQLDDHACSEAVTRLFDRSALKASLQLLLLGGESDNNDNNNDDGVEEALQNIKASPLQTLHERDEMENDPRRLSICYYLTPTDWEEAFGGHLTFGGSSSGGGDDDDDDNSDITTTTIHAKRNRLMVWLSHDTKYRREPFKGSDTVPQASCIELNLVEATL